jgi:hypothetical protein
MPPALTLRRKDGAITIEGAPVVISGGMSIDVARDALHAFASEPRDMRNGYEGVELRGLSLAGYPSVVDLRFAGGVLTSLSFRLAPPPRQADDDWPVDPSEEEIALAQHILAQAFGRRFASGTEVFRWGRVWSRTTQKGGELGPPVLAYADHPPAVTLPAFHPGQLVGLVLFIGILIRACR